MSRPPKPKTPKDPRMRPCENPDCRSIDSTQCSFTINQRTGNVVARQQEEARAAGCRVVRFLDP